MRRLGLALLVWGALGSWSDRAAATVTACEWPDQHVSVTRILGGFDQAQVLGQMRADGTLPPDPGACWEIEDGAVPSKFRPDPRGSGQQISQRHRWRRAGNAIIVDPTIKQPHGEVLRREYGRLFPPIRWAEVVTTSLGSALDRAVRDGRWVDVRAALDQTGAGQPLTAAEIAQFRAILRNYEAD